MNKKLAFSAVLLVLLAPVLALTYFTTQAHKAKQDAFQNLESIVKLKSESLGSY